MSHITGGGSGGGSSGRTILTGDANYYIATPANGGNDTNPGTLAQPWATLQHAMRFLAANIDLAGHNVFVNIGAGTFVGLGVLWTSGGGNIQWQGAGSGLTFIDNGVNDIVVNSGECLSFYFSVNTVHLFIKMTFKPSVDVFAIIDAFAPCICLFYDIPGTTKDVKIDCTNLASTTDVVFWVDNPAAQFIDKGITYIGGGASIDNIFLVEAGGEYIIGTDSTPSSVTGALTVNALAWADLSGAISVGIAGGGAVTGAGVIGQRFHVGIGGFIGQEGQPAGTIGPNAFAGTVAGICDPGGSYDGFIGAIQASGLPTTTQFPDTGTGGLYKDKSGGGIYEVYNDANAIILVNGFQARVSSQFNKSADTTLATITGLSYPLLAGRTYNFRAYLHVSPDAVGGHKYAIGTPDTLTATAIIYQINSTNNSTNANIINSRQTALGGSIGVVSGTSDYTEIIGTITVGVAGTLAVQFAQNVASGTSSVLVGSFMIVHDMP